MPEREAQGKLRPLVAITIGDINGVGPEVILKCLADRQILKFFVPVLVGPISTFRAQAAALGLNSLTFRVANENLNVDVKLDDTILVVEPVEGQDPPVRTGQITETAGRVAMASVALATDLCLKGRVDAMVTAPISKEAISKAGFNVPGHTEFIASRSNTAAFTMMMVAEKLRVGLVTAHVPVVEVPAAISKAAICEKLAIIGESLKFDFGVARPKIAVLGLNPHAGDGGVIGTEEQEIIAPAINQVRSSGRMVYGPFPADGFFASRKYDSFDAVLAMYHDQGLAPFKVLSFNSGVNFTAGLPIVRTSPDHGTAFDIAGKNQAAPDSMRNAIYTAIDITRRRTRGRAGAAEHAT
jgi:4-hydroxythreonine-4-phosphate dehydrogenase